jgi:hypothetical protein
MEKRHYKARCHCGRLRFSFDCEEIRAGVRCNCSICVRKGAVMSTGYIPARDFVPIADASDIIEYRWNDRVVGHVFCRTCGIYPYHGDAEMGYRVNLGCVSGLDVLALDIRVLDGRSMPVADGTEASRS